MNLPPVTNSKYLFVVLLFHFLCGSCQPSGLKFNEVGSEEQGEAEISLNKYFKTLTRRSENENEVPQPIKDYFGTKSTTTTRPPEKYSWRGKWFPKPPNDSIQHDDHGRVAMGVSNDNCDDGKTNLTLDWDYSPINYTCFHPDTEFPLDPTLTPILECEKIERDYRPRHYCMKDAISYSHPIPTTGDHRPLWPKFGEYKFVPKQRWLHNIEHGAVVFLYHPCSHPMEVKKVKKLLSECIGKHVISPYNLVPSTRPFVLVAWGCRLLMASADENLILEFIRKRGMKGPEGHYPKEGQYDNGLIRKSTASYNSTC